nr:SCP2 sterol-binding domain-containing protein [uncultured Rhodopila sp.]
MQRSRPLAAATLSLIPGPVLARLTVLLTRAMRRRHPRLVANFARLDPAVVHVFPSDLPHRFAIEFGGGKMDVRVLPGADVRARPGDEPLAPDAEIRGNLMALIDLLEGRTDGDAMFFSREIEITGSTAVIVAVRNTLDREEIAITDEIAAIFGPFERPARRIARGVDDAIGRARARIATIHARLHEADGPARDLGAECDALRAEVKALKARVAKFDVRQMRTDSAATGAP